jgi:hypothetical protein
MRLPITRLRLRLEAEQYVALQLRLPEQHTTARERARKGNSLSTTGFLLEAVPPQTVARAMKILT